MAAVEFIAVFLLSFLVSEVVAKTSRPWMTKESSVVLDLKCQVPWRAFRDMDNWHSVLELNITFLASGSSRNETMATLYPGTPSLPANSLHDMAEVDHWGGHKDTRAPFISIRMPLTKKDFGTYFCDILYEKSDTENAMESYRISITRETFKDSVHVTQESFTALATKADKITVSWAAPSSHQHRTLDISRLHLGLEKNGRVDKNWISLAILHEDKMLPGKAETLLARAVPSDDITTVTIYVANAPCYWECAYTCVAHSLCSEDQSCDCEGPGAGPQADTDAAATGSETCLVYIVPMIILAVCFAACTGVCCLHRNRFLCDKKFFLHRFVCCPKSLSEITDQLLNKNEPLRGRSLPSCSVCCPAHVQHPEGEHNELRLSHREEEGEEEERNQQNDQCVGPSERRGLLPASKPSQCSGQAELDSGLQERLRDGRNCNRKVVRDGRRFFCKSDDVFVVFDSQSNAEDPLRPVYWSFVRGKRLLPEEFELLSAFRRRRSVPSNELRDNEREATEVLQTLMERIRRHLPVGNGLTNSAAATSSV